MSRTAEVLGLKPRYSLESGVKDYLDSGFLVKR
jgi:nucleoside-diphosphate-sugar epimerase